MNYGILYLDHKELVVGIGKLIYSCCSVYLLLILLIYVPCISLCIPGEMICNHENIFIFPLVLANFEKSVDNISNGHCNFMDASGPLSVCRGGSRTAGTTKMELFVIIVNGFQPLIIITKCSILDVETVLDSPLSYFAHLWQIKISSC